MLWFAVEVILWLFLLLEFCGFVISVGLILLFVFGVVGVSSFLLPLLLSGWWVNLWDFVSTAIMVMFSKALMMRRNSCWSL